MSDDPYRTLGVGYATGRQTDPDIDTHVTRALRGCSTVVDIGAGTGSYEPRGTVLAVEPSPTMIAQRSPGAAPVVRACAEALPLPDDAADAALAILTTHHWADPAAGVAELVRVAPRQVVLTWDPPTLARDFWLVAEYLPEIGEYERDLACLDAVTALLAKYGTTVSVTPVPISGDCVDGVLAAHWRRPWAYLDGDVRAAASGLASLPADVLDPALERLAGDLDSGRWATRHRELLALGHLDVGYRLIRSVRPEVTGKFGASRPHGSNRARNAASRSASSVV